MDNTNVHQEAQLTNVFKVLHNLSHDYINFVKQKVELKYMHFATEVVQYITANNFVRSF